jgi:AraC family transcriptional regulator
LIHTLNGPPDPVLGHLIGAIEAEVEAGCPAGPLFLESLGNSAAFYLAQRYGVFRCPVSCPYGGLSRDRLKRVVGYIEAHLASDLSVAELAGVACLSAYHFGKMFKRSTGLSVHTYLTGRRILHAQRLLRAGELSLAEVAEACGFSDQNSLGAVFRRRLGVTPGAYRRMTT